MFCFRNAPKSTENDAKLQNDDKIVEHKPYDQASSPASAWSSISNSQHPKKSEETPLFEIFKRKPTLALSNDLATEDQASPSVSARSSISASQHPKKSEKTPFFEIFEKKTNPALSNDLVPKESIHSNTLASVKLMALPVDCASGRRRTTNFIDDLLKKYKI